MIAGRNTMGDAAWTALGAIEQDADYYAAFEQHFGVDIRPRL